MRDPFSPAINNQSFYSKPKVAKPRGKHPHSTLSPPSPFSILQPPSHTPSPFYFLSMKPSQIKTKHKVKSD
ncbi:hypothetical protein JHK86_047741 [Glycine max]|nr:hypothetical protein JHK86_047741 [Glycine max]